MSVIIACDVGGRTIYLNLKPHRNSTLDRYTKGHNWTERRSDASPLDESDAAAILLDLAERWSPTYRFHSEELTLCR